MHSSSTTGQQPSRIVIDKTTAFRQARALVSILKEHIGDQRRPLLVLDAAESVAAGDSLTARGAAIRGIGNFASETVFAMDRSPSGDLQPDWDRIEASSPSITAQPVLLFGFTFIVWTRFVAGGRAPRHCVSTRRRPSCCTPAAGRNWPAQAVSKEEFSRRTAAVLGCDPRRILDFYGMVEQVGTVFVDCAAGNKHAPAFADVIIRRPAARWPGRRRRDGHHRGAQRRCRPAIPARRC